MQLIDAGVVHTRIEETRVKITHRSRTMETLAIQRAHELRQCWSSP